MDSSVEILLLGWWYGQLGCGMNKSTIYGVGIGIVIGGMIYTVLYMWHEQEYYMGLNSTIYIQYYIWDEQEYNMGLVVFHIPYTIYIMDSWAVG